MENEEKKTCVKAVSNFDTLACVCGLSFPDSVNEFQKAALTLAHMMASLRESVLKGSVIPMPLVYAVNDLASVMMSWSDEQR